MQWDLRIETSWVPPFGTKLTTVLIMSAVVFLLVAGARNLQEWDFKVRDIFNPPLSSKGLGIVVPNSRSSTDKNIQHVIMSGT